MKVLNSALTTVIGALSALMLLVSPAVAAEAPLDHQSIHFFSDGSRLKGDVFKPAGLTADQKLPGILLIHGWGGNKGKLNGLALHELLKGRGATRYVALPGTHYDIYKDEGYAQALNVSAATVPPAAREFDPKSVRRGSR